MMKNVKYSPESLAKMSLPLLAASCSVELGQYLAHRPTLLERTHELGQRLLAAARASENELACDGDVRAILAAVRRAARGAEDAECGKELQRFAQRKGERLADVSALGSAPVTELLDLRNFTVRMAAAARQTPRAHASKAHTPHKPQVMNLMP